MSMDQITAIKIADLRSKKIRRVANVAYGDGLLTAFFAFTCFLCVFSDIITLPLGIGLAYVAYTSLRNAAAIRKFDVKAPRRLALNQGVLAAIVILYSLYELWVASKGGGVGKAFADPDLAQFIDMKDAQRMAWNISLALYGGVIGGTILVQGLTAAYYFSRTHIIEEFLEVTPKWVVDFRKTIPR